MIYFFYGREEYKIEKEISLLKDKYSDSAFKSMNFRIYHSPAPTDLFDICTTPPLMFGGMVSVVHCENYFFRQKNKKIEFTDEQIKSLKFALKNTGESNTIIFVCCLKRDDNKKLDTRTKLFKTLAEVSDVKEFEQFRGYDKGFVPYVTEMIKSKDMTADTKTVIYLTERLGVNLRLIDSELNKIKAAVYPNKKFTVKDADEYCIITEDVFKLADLVTERDKNKLLKEYLAVCEKSHSLEVIALLHTNLRKLIYVKTYEKAMSVKSISENLRMPEYPIKLIMQRIKDIPLKKLTKLKHNLTEAEYKIKTGNTVSPEHLLESVLLRQN